MTKTDVANLALSKLGEPVIDDIEDTGDPLARRALLHYEPTLKEVLRAHFWDFAQAVAEVSRMTETTPAVAASATITWPIGASANYSATLVIGGTTVSGFGPIGATTTQVQSDGAADLVKQMIDFFASATIATSRVGNVITLTSKTAGAAGNAITLTKSGTSLVLSGATFTGGEDAAGDIDAALLTSGLLGWAAAYEMPDDFVKLRRVMTEEGARVDDFERRRIDGRACLLAAEYDALFIEYVQLVDDPDVYDPLFLEAFTTLLASKMARAVTGSEAMEADLRQAYEMMALPAARTADSHDSQSAENRPIDDIIRGGLLRPRADFLSDLDN